MSELINGRTVEEIKRGLRVCNGWCDLECPYSEIEYGCVGTMVRDALALIERLEAQVPRWISVEERQPSAFVSVMVHMTDAGDFPAVREGFRVSDNVYLVPALAETHPVDYWMEMPEMEGAK